MEDPNMTLIPQYGDCIRVRLYISHLAAPGTLVHVLGGKKGVLENVKTALQCRQYTHVPLLILEVNISAITHTIPHWPLPLLQKDYTLTSLTTALTGSLPPTKLGQQ